MILHHATPERTLDALAARFRDAPAGTRLEAWTFDDRAARRRAEGQLATRGVTARIRSAYKPIVTFFLEDARPGFTAARIAYPVTRRRSRTASCWKAIPSRRCWPRPP